MIIDFFNNAIRLKSTPRQGWIDKLSISNPESVADHSYSMAIMGMVLSDMKGYDSDKVLKMILLHDLAESEIGDYTPEQVSIEKKHEIEDEAFSKITKVLPNSTRSEYMEIWQEFKKGITAESKLVHQIDRLELALQAKAYQKEGHPQERLELFFEYAKKGITDPKLCKLFEEIKGVRE